jgi:putative peptidoglycan lipid II flippase
MILAEPIISLIYQHGRFTAEATLRTAEALRFYAMGLVGYSAVKVLAPAFYAIDRRNLPMLVSLFSIAVNFCLNWLLTLHLGLAHRGLALSTSVVAMTNFALLYLMMRRYSDGLETRTVIVTTAKLCLAGAALAAVCLAAQWLFFGTLADQRLLQKAIEMTVTITVAAAVFFGAAYLLRVKEVEDVATLIRKRFGQVGR